MNFRELDSWWGIFEQKDVRHNYLVFCKTCDEFKYAEWYKGFSGNWLYTHKPDEINGMICPNCRQRNDKAH